MIAAQAGWFDGAISLLTFILIYFILWKIGRTIAREMAERNDIFGGFLEKPDETDFAAT